MPNHNHTMHRLLSDLPEASARHYVPPPCRCQSKSRFCGRKVGLADITYNGLAYPFATKNLQICVLHEFGDIFLFVLTVLLCAAGLSPPAAFARNQRTLQFFFSHHNRFIYVLSQRYIQNHHHAEAHGKGNRTNVGMLTLRHFRYQLLHYHIKHSTCRKAQQVRKCRDDQPRA